MTDYENKDPNNEYMNRPSMKQDDHPEHNMPPSQHDGVELLKSAMKGRHDYSYEKDQSREVSDKFR